MRGMNIKEQKKLTNVSDEKNSVFSSPKIRRGWRGEGKKLQRDKKLLTSSPERKTPIYASV